MPVGSRSGSFVLPAISARLVLAARLTAAELYAAPAYPVLRQRLSCIQVAVSTAAVENSGSAAEAAHCQHPNLIPVPRAIRVPCLDAVAPGSLATHRQWSRCQQEPMTIHSLPR